jgi:hypothetical protein
MVVANRGRLGACPVTPGKAVDGLSIAARGGLEPEAVTGVE